MDKAKEDTTKTVSRPSAKRHQVFVKLYIDWSDKETGWCEFCEAKNVRVGTIVSTYGKYIGEICEECANGRNGPIQNVKEFYKLNRPQCIKLLCDPETKKEYELCLHCKYLKGTTRTGTPGDTSGGASLSKRR